jgi:AcrR family transcriptional regulator
MIETTERRSSVGAQRSPASEAAILKAAEEILLEGGLAKFSIEAVARRATAGKPTIYRWWPSKAALLLDVYHRQKNVVLYPDTGNLEQDLLLMLASLFAFWREGSGGTVFRSIIAEAQSDPGAAKALYDYAADRRVQTADLIRHAQARGEVGPEISATIAAEIIAGFAWGRLLTNRLDQAPEDIETAIKQMVAGLLPRPSKP